MDIRSSLKMLPSVERVLEDPRVAERINLMSRIGITGMARDAVAGFRDRLQTGELVVEKGRDLLEPVVEKLIGELESIESGIQRRVINATGVILYTNLGRAVLSEGVMDAVHRAGTGYIDLEIDLGTGRRSERAGRVVTLLKLLTGCEDAVVVNNNAAALMLAVDTFAGEGAVAVSRGELVEIGGSFRLPEILAGVAGKVIEVGTTNRTHLGDYERAIDDGATMLLKVHTSNYRIEGFTDEVQLRDLAALGGSRGVPVMYDQGSGILYPLHTEGVEGEECIGDLLGSGVDMISFSTDKILGGPQGGALLGSKEMISRVRANHLLRALRLDKLLLAGLEQVLLRYWRGEFSDFPVLNMIMEDFDRLEHRAERIARALEPVAAAGGRISVEKGEASIGGGSYPQKPIRTTLVLVGLPSGVPERAAERLRGGDPSILVRVKGDCMYIDPRTVFEKEEETLVRCIIETVTDFLQGE